MLKPIFAAMLSLVLVSGLAHAQRADNSDANSRPDLSADDRAALLNARIAGLKAGLELTSDQEKNWGAFEQAIRELAKARAERSDAVRNAAAGEDPIARIRRRAEFMSRTGAALKQFAEAAQPFYQTLNEGQKHRIEVLARALHLRVNEGWRAQAAANWDRGAGGRHGGDRDRWNSERRDREGRNWGEGNRESWRHGPDRDGWSGEGRTDYGRDREGWNRDERDGSSRYRGNWNRDGRDTDGRGADGWHAGEREGYARERGDWHRGQGDRDDDVYDSDD